MNYKTADAVGGERRRGGDEEEHVSESETKKKTTIAILDSCMITHLTAEHVKLSVCYIQKSSKKRIISGPGGLPDFDTTGFLRIRNNAARISSVYSPGALAAYKNQGSLIVTEWASKL